MDNQIFLLITLCFANNNSAALSKNAISNCKPGRTTNRVQSCGVCQSGTIHSLGRLSCYNCPDFCVLGFCKLKSDTSNPDDATLCEKCINNYFMKQGKCYKCLPGCKKCDSIDKCQDCAANFALRRNSNDCLPCPHNCEKCSWLTNSFRVQCEVCKAGYTVTSKNCIACGSFCKSCIYHKSKGINCTTCDSNAYKITKNNITTCNLCSTSMTGCFKCSNKDSCTKCISKSYALTTSKKCVKCSSIHSACLECEAHDNANKCIKCNIGYYKKDDSCSSCPRNCHSCLETNNAVKCSKCMDDYTILAAKACDKCPDNCLECEVSSGNLICKADKCKPKYTRNSNNLCSKCPDKCNECTWNSANFRTECTGTNFVHSCTEKENGKSWTRRSDGSCAACPNNCDKCYFEKNTAKTPICYASMCQKTYTYDDESGICISCPVGCDYCKKRTAGLTCLQCSEGFASNYGNSSSIIESCVACSIENCDYCEVIANEIKCIRSPCTNSTTGKFSFKTGTCEDRPVSDTSFSTILDESVHSSDDVSFDYDIVNEYIEPHVLGSTNDMALKIPPPPCPVGRILIPTGPHVGLCRNCGYNCNECQLNSGGTDVECRTCIGNSQWVVIEVDGVVSKGCYDCSIARPQCKYFERFGTAPNYKCRCKRNQCIGDQTDFNIGTVFQEPASEFKPFQKCTGCSEKFPNALQCSGVNTGSLSINSCKTGFTKTFLNNTSCLKIGEFCSGWSSLSPVKCLACAVGSYFSSGLCLPCPVGCSECISEGSIIYCIACSNGKTGIDCQSPPSVCDSINVDNCNIKWNVAFFKSTPNCQCLGCDTYYRVDNIVPGSNGMLGAACTSTGTTITIANCQQMALDYKNETICTKCIPPYLLDDGTCKEDVPDCKSGFTYFRMNEKVCQVPKKHFVVSSNLRILRVPKNRDGGKQWNSECIYNSVGESRLEDEAIANCLEYSSPAEFSTVSECTKCIAGWALEQASSTSSSKCHQCQLGCETCIVDVSSTPTTVNRCTVCSKSYALNNAGTCIKCPYNCDECRVDPENQNNALCLSFGCTSGALNDANFSCQSCSIANCAICVQQINGMFKCLKCNQGYYKDDDGICQACMQNCPFCFNNQSCIPDGCKEGFIRHRTEGTCLPCIGDGVARCSFDTATFNILIPEMCKIGFRLDTSTNPPSCERCDPNCKICNAHGIAKCDDEQCNFGYFYDPTDQKCYKEKTRCDKSIRKCPTGCKSCSLVGGMVQCTACLPTYGLREGLCDKCNSDKCQICEIPPGETSMVCTLCLQQYYLNNDECGKCPTHCKECNHNGNYQCKTCMKRYGRSPDGTCRLCPSNCETCVINTSQISTCTKCISNEFSLQIDGTCMPCSSAAFTNCATCTKALFNRKTVCKSCDAGFSLSDDGESCVFCSISKCSMCIHGNICSECKTGFHLSNYNRDCVNK
ncbi:DgyrCDS14431 [Dimorphilus gyrociliatus]|uniref:DgyrCDS14431 n=1 Tax=Dimorphilus gyrociliatus TaxID=2664684 RepID=A0A7I8WDK7_9ANNE|nr:DgyrCDS14431 [Dimorphilus gyrociliatus]